MTQLDLPPVSLQRYLELLKRRRWQVVPVSLLGLLIGGLVAFFIPRWFVAETRLQYEHEPGAPQVRSEDPFARIVDSAKSTMPFAAEAVMRKLGWSEVAARDPYEVQQAVRGVQQRLQITDHNAGDKGRTYAQIHVSFRDRDGKRAAAFLNTLVETWVDARLEEMRSRAEAQQRRASDDYTSALNAHDEIRSEIATLQREHGLDPKDDPVSHRESLRARDREELERGARIEKLEGEISGLRAAYDLAEDAFAAAPKFVPAEDLAKREDLKDSPLVAGMFEQLMLAEQSLKSVMGPAHPHRRARERQVTLLKEKLGQLMAQYGQELGPGGEVPNPRRADLRRAADAARQQLETKEAEHGKLVAQAAAADRRRAQLIGAYAEYELKLARQKDAEQRREAANRALEAANQYMALLANQQTIEILVPAAVPPRPTEPNIALVALLGSVLGLGAAVVLILLLDMVQGTFKTVEDVERGLPVPVLGSVSHLETAEQRRKVVVGRRRASVFAGAVVLLVVVVVTVYYVDPTRLPPFARDLLAIVLGG